MVFLIKYLIGYPGWDKPRTVKFVSDKDTITIDNYRGGVIVINGKDILDVSFDLQSKRSGTRAATGALVGGLLTGGVGLLAGAAIGAKAKDKSALTILFNENGRERTIVLETKKQTNAIFNEINDVIEYAKNPPVEPVVSKVVDSPKTEPIKTVDSPKTESTIIDSDKTDNKPLLIMVFVVMVLILIFLFWLVISKQ